MRAKRAGADLAARSRVPRGPLSLLADVQHLTGTRNPARGFLQLPEHFVVAMMDVGHLRWGACEFGAGANGDVHHYDLHPPHHEPASTAAGTGGTSP